jgi:hypothetical protein
MMNNKKQPKRRVRSKDVQLLKSLQCGSDNSKDIFDLLKEKFLDDASSAWYQGELLYIVSVTRRKDATAVNSGLGTNYTNTDSNSARQARYLAMFKKIESPYLTCMLKILKKDADLEVKHSYEINKLRSIDYGAEENELILSFEQVDYSLYFRGTLDRDETLWIISQVYKAVSGSELSIGYSVDIDALSYMMTTSGSVVRFPPLQKLISMVSASVGDRFSADEAQAEQILDQLQWSKSLSEQMDIHQILSVNSKKLNNEIIDFLLQWEEMDETASLATSVSSRTSSTTKVFGMRDTKEVLLALTEVDGQLETVDRWLGEQIEHLAEIQANLHMIEDESGALETSWQNLNVVQDVVMQLVKKYSLEESQEMLLQYPERSLGPLFKLTSLQQIERYITPLQEAAEVLRDALVFKATDLCGLSSAQWKQIQGITAITDQKKKLVDISEIFANKLSEWAVMLFDWLLKHKALVEGDGTTVTRLLPKQLSTVRAAVEEVCNLDFDGFISNPTKKHKYRLPRSKYRSIEHNQLLESQALYHTQVCKFATLLDLLVELQPTYSRQICEAYMRATHERLYTPLLKALVKDLQSQITCKQTPLSLTNCAKFRSDSASNLVLRFESKNSPSAKVFYSWRLFEVALLLISPLIDAEEAFIKVRCRSTS